MPEALKNLYNRQLIYSVAESIHQVYPAFEINAFTSTVFDENWPDKELKERMSHIARMLHQHLPSNYRQAVNILKTMAPEFSGFEYMFFPAFVELYGLDDFDRSTVALEHFTEFSSSEFAVRSFIRKYDNKMVACMVLWAQSDNEHVRIKKLIGYSNMAAAACSGRGIRKYYNCSAFCLPIMSQFQN